MKKILCTLLVLMAVACVSETESEDIGTESSAFVAYGYCEVNPSTNVLTGRCRGGQGMCCAKSVSTCNVGATAGTVSRYPAMCGAVYFDTSRTCQQYC